MRLLFKILYPLCCGMIGWALGATYRAPPVIIETTDRFVIATGDMIRDALETREEAIETITATGVLDGITNGAPPSDNPQTDKPTTADGSQKRTNTETITLPSAPGKLTPAPIASDEIILPANGLSPFVLPCKKTSISNRPPINSHGHLAAYRQLINVEGVTMAMMPVREACLSSGFGRRRGKMHKGVDYYSKKGGMIFAAADGQILEAEYRDDYGFTVLLNHGNGYFTRYAHLAGFSRGVKVGAAIPLGFALGEMGTTAAYRIPKHLHFELLRGNYDTPKKSFGLEPVDIFAL